MIENIENITRVDFFELCQNNPLLYNILNVWKRDMSFSFEQILIAGCVLLVRQNDELLERLKDEIQSRPATKEQTNA